MSYREKRFSATSVGTISFARQFRFWTILATLFLAGCQPAYRPPHIDDLTENGLRQGLEAISKTGEGERALVSVRGPLQELQAENPEKWQSLVDDFEKLAGAETEEDRMQIADEMLAKLEKMTE